MIKDESFLRAYQSRMERINYNITLEGYRFIHELRKIESMSLKSPAMKDNQGL